MLPQEDRPVSKEKELFQKAVSQEMSGIVCPCQVTEERLPQQSGSSSVQRGQWSSLASL